MGRLDQDILFRKAEGIELLVMDVDGILTDGRIVYDSRGEQIQSFHVRDGFGIHLLHKAGVKTAVLSARCSNALAVRCNELGITHVMQGHSRKLQGYEGLLSLFGLMDSQVAYMGDDWLDLPVLSRVGFAVTVPDAASQVKDYCHHVTVSAGGAGAVREVCELILKAKNCWHVFFNEFIEGSLEEGHANLLKAD